MTPLLDVRNLKAYYHQRSGFFGRIEVKAVDDVTLQIKSGETLAVVGESGSGKTTLGRAILRLMDLADGSVTFDGIDVANLGAREIKEVRRRLQAVFQDPYSSISPYMSVHNIVEEPLLIHRIGAPAERRDLILAALEQVKLSPAAEIAQKFPHALSGGQRQRVSLARAMVLKPDLVIADEPVSMVDASSRTEILSLLRELQESNGTAFLYITHDITNARHFSDRIAVMYAGAVVETGLTREVIDQPLHPYTKGLLAAVPDPDPQNRTRLRAVIPGEPPTGGSTPSGCPFHPRCPEFQSGRCEIQRPALATPERELSGAQSTLSESHQVACVLFE